MTTCRHCQRRIVYRIVYREGLWVDPEATGDDLIWRETCDGHDTFTAEHEPEGRTYATIRWNGRQWLVIAHYPGDVDTTIGRYSAKYKAKAQADEFNNSQA